jgi:hypothetical protein
MRKQLFDSLLNNSTFLSLFYNARKSSEEKNIPLEASFIETGLNTYKTWFFPMCETWGLKNLDQVRDFDKMVRTI